jgi:hypothetical protein
MKMTILGDGGGELVVFRLGAGKMTGELLH